MFQHGFLGILRARGVEPAARAEKWRDKLLVEHDRERECAPQDHAASSRAMTAVTSRASRSYDSLPAAGRATMTMRSDRPGDASPSSAPLMRRFTRLRTTALPTALETVTAMRHAPPGEAATWAPTVGAPACRPLRRTNAISPGRLSGAYHRTVARSRSRRSGAYGPFCGARRSPYDRFSCSCARESHGRAYGAGCAVGKCVSR